jgi:5-hydroxyisourate hydrolase
MISTHILDTSIGLPAAGVQVQLELNRNGNWDLLSSEETNTDGRIAFNCPTQPGTYRLQFFTEAYFQRNKQTVFFSLVPVIFQISDPSRKYHVPLLLNPYGYSTYRGS